MHRSEIYIMETERKMNIYTHSGIFGSVVILVFTEQMGLTSTVLNLKNNTNVNKKMGSQWHRT